MNFFEEHIEDYIHNRLTGRELDTFLAELKRNEDLQNKVHEMQLVKEALTDHAEEEDVRKSLHTVRQELAGDSGARIVPFNTILKYAAALVVLFAISSLLYANLNYSTKAIFEQHYSMPKDLSIFMSNESPSTALNDIYRKIENEELADAIRLGQELIAKEPNNNEAKFVLAHGLTQNAQCQRASTLFEELSTFDLFRSDCQFQLALCAIQSEDLDLARSRLAEMAKNSDHAYQSEAQDILNALNSVWRKWLI